MSGAGDSDVSYRKTIGGALTLKGRGALKSVKKAKKHKKKKSKHKSKKRDREAAGEGGGEGEDVILVHKRGTGRLLTSGTTVHGQKTKFMDELNIGDAIIIAHPTSMQDETRIVTMVLSNVSISLSSPLSTDLVSSVPFHYVKKPKSKSEVKKEEQDRATKKQRKTEEEEKLAFGTYAGRTTFTYRVKKAGAFGGYKVITETVGGEGSKSRGALLDMRAKKKSDRMCM